MSKKINNKQEVAEGKIIDFIDGKLRKDSQTEQVRQNFERTLMEEYGYVPQDIGVNFKIKIMEGTRKLTKNISLVVFHEDKKEIPDQDDVDILIIVVKPKGQPTDAKGGTDDLEKMLVASPKARFACWTNGIETLFFQKKKAKFDTDIFPVNDFPRKGESDASIFTTDRSRLRIATGNNLLYAFKRCHDYIHANQGGSKEQIFGSFSRFSLPRYRMKNTQADPGLPFETSTNVIRL